MKEDLACVIVAADAKKESERYTNAQEEGAKITRETRASERARKKKME